MAEHRKIPEHEAIYRRIRDAILFGALAPGQGVTIQGLARMIGAGMTPVREAIRRLTSEGALQTMDNRRIAIPRLTPGQCEELRLARIALEPKLAEMAAEKAPAGLVDDLVALDGALNDALSGGAVEGYLCHNYRFHFRLYDAAQAHILTAIAQTLWLRAGPSLRVVCDRLDTMALPDMHLRAIRAIRNGDARAAGQAIADDIHQGMDQIRGALETPAPPKGD